jgi:hypothetical protein
MRRSPSAPISKPSGRSVDLSGFDVGTPVSTPKTQSSRPTGPSFGQPGFYESLSAKKTPVKTEVKKPVQSPEDIAKLKAEIASDNANASVTTKKAPAKAPNATKKPTVAPKPVKTATKDVPAKKEPIKKDSSVTSSLKTANALAKLSVNKIKDTLKGYTLSVLNDLSKNIPGGHEISQYIKEAIRNKSK